MYRSDKIRGKQAEKGSTNEETAQRAGVHPNTYSAIRKGKPVSSRSLEKVAAALEMPMADVYAPKESESAFAGTR
jgi:DNA-binding XRE family transcriptional regulator